MSLQPLTVPQGKRDINYRWGQVEKIPEEPQDDMPVGQICLNFNFQTKTICNESK